MEKKTKKSKGFFSLFTLDWDDKPKQRKPEKILYVSANAGEYNVAESKERPIRSRSSEKKPPEPAPRVRSKSVKAEAPVQPAPSKHHHGVVVHRTQSPFPSPHLVRKASHGKADSLAKNSGKTAANVKCTTETNAEETGEKFRRRSEVVTLKDAKEVVEERSRRKSEYLRQQSGEDGTLDVYYQNVEELGRVNHSHSSSHVTPDSRRKESVSSHEPILDDDQKQAGKNMANPLKNISASLGKQEQPKRTEIEEPSQNATGYDRPLRIRGRGATMGHVNKSLADSQNRVADISTKAKYVQTAADRKLASTITAGTAGSIRNLSDVLRGDRHSAHDRQARKLKSRSNDLTFETAVLSLIRLRRLEAKLRRSRDRFVQELQLFRGWNDDRHIHVLDQIANCNNQMDDLDPLIASLEEFINEQHSPPYVPEDEVLRYPVSYDQRKLFPGPYDQDDYRLAYDLRQPKSSIHEPYISSASQAVSHQQISQPRYPEVTRSVGRSGLNAQFGQARASRPTILPQSDQSDLDRELDALTNQVRQLKQQNNELLQVTAKQNPVTVQSSTTRGDSFHHGTDRLSSNKTIHRKRDGNETATDYDRNNADENTGLFQPNASNNDQVENRGSSHSIDTLKSPPPSKQSGHNSSSLASTTTNSSDEVSVDDPYQYEDFIEPALYDSYLEDSLTKLQNIMRDLEENPLELRRNLYPPKLTREASTDYSNTHDDFGRYTPQENGLPESPVLTSGHPPLPPTRKLKTGPPTRLRRHHTISSGNPSGIYSPRRAYSGDRYNSDYEALSDDVIPSRKSSLDDEESVAYDLQFRLNSPDPIDIPERYLDADVSGELEDESLLRKRKAKAEDIRRMLAVPEPGTSDREQRDREKVLHMTPILAREVTERSRRVALQARNRAAGR